MFRHRAVMQHAQVSMASVWIAVTWRLNRRTLVTSSRRQSRTAARNMTTSTLLIRVTQCVLMPDRTSVRRKYGTATPDHHNHTQHKEKKKLLGNFAGSFMKLRTGYAVVRRTNCFAGHSFILKGKTHLNFRRI